MRPIPALPVVLVTAALAFAGCGGDGDDDGSGGGSSTPPPATQQQSGGERTTTTPAPATADGAKVFASAGCGSCHTLAAARSNGNIGPNLDDLKPSTEEVRRQVTNGGGGMPAFEGDLSDEEIDAVARYVVANAGR
jgi:mono/diheme cytochrome c family protein